ncbi:MAG: helicase-related protein, partial [Eubacteriales bacterium]|nr:helicase-related protein [Eubacteriales bacterium]
YIIRTEKREAIDNSGKKLFKNRMTKAVELTWDERHTMQKELYELTSNYVARGYNKAMRNRGKYMWYIFLLIMMQRLVTSSTAAIRKSLERRLGVLEAQDFEMGNLTEEELAEMETEANMEEGLKALSLDVKKEVSEISEIIAVAKQAEFQYLDVKVEPLMDIIDNLFAEDKDQKVIVFTEFVATQQYLSNLLETRGYTTSLLNGSLSIEERNTVIEEFKTKTNVLISTDAGGEGLNLQFCNVVINYDLPWNPMKIEQRIGRVDRIGQQRDVYIYNFILTDTVEKRVKDVLEQKLSVILEEMGIDKYSDILDNEISELNFTNAYMESIRNPEDIEFNVRHIENDLKTQVKNANEFRSILHEDKDLTALVGVESGFDVESALRQMAKHYEDYKGYPHFPIQNLSINDIQIIKHLKKDIRFNRSDGALAVNIQDFPNEKGYFALWEISLADRPQAKRIIPIFINEQFILRPLAGEKIWDQMISTASTITADKTIAIDADVFDHLVRITHEFAYQIFLDMKADFEKKNDETYRKYLYAIELRIEAAKRIGIENIREHKLRVLAKEKLMVETNYEAGKQICPEFKPVFMAYME